jgi:hypothetical protein
MMKTRQSICAVVDAYSTGRVLAPLFAAHGYETVHVRSGTYIADFFKPSFRPGDFLEDIDCEGQIGLLSERLCAGNRRVLCVVPGAESGVVVADALSERLGVASNGSAQSLARRDKFVMAEAVRLAGLRTIRQIKSRSADEIGRWMTGSGLSRIVIKPTASQGTYGFHICENPEQVAPVLGSLLGAKDVLGNVVSDVLAQELLEGTEYSVNAVSRDGRPCFTDIWRTQKRRAGQSKVYDFETLVDPDEAVHATLVAYVRGVLKAVGIDHGPSHTEIMVTADGNPVLIETAARLMGTLDLSLVVQATGTNAALVTAEAYLAPELFSRRLAAPPVRTGRRCAMVQMLARKEGVLKRYGYDKLQRLGSFYGVDTNLEPGERVKQTINSYTSPGLIFLCAEDQAQLSSDYREIRSMEETGELYEIE